ncbi:MAG: ABC transporter ATP-binding protein [Candidatus Omnitrophica bacterium]|jgi:lipopolysaccharide transport system ATP-binding protein|nr:ABC transporter ATP-binding protein [Candidatus Omnitrophota bacterium]
MSDIVLKSENLSKKYVIGHQVERGRYIALRDVLMQNAKVFLDKAMDLTKGKAIIQGNSLEEVWALKDINFEINRGEVVGIIGRNGAGKSTLLKILSRITEPSAGQVTIKGRVASLLEVGTGFHPELSGRENIYLNGAILGMSRVEIKRKFDAIVAFSEVEQYLDTPVKRYSSGMYVRLAFAVAAHLEPEILVVDEVLAVGDTQFQKKCLGKMDDVAHQGRTVLFVSHNMNAIQRLCKRCIVLRYGAMIFDGESSSAIANYLKTNDLNQQVSWPQSSLAPGNDIIRLRSVRIVGDDGHVHSQFDVRDPIKLEIEFQVFKDTQAAIIVQFVGALGTYIMASMDNYINGPWGKQSPYTAGIYKTSCCIPGDFLNEGQLSINLWIYSPPLAPSQSPHVRLFNVVSADIGDRHDPGGARGQFPYEWGMEPAVRPKLQWLTEKNP